MARKNKENKNMALSTMLRDEGDSSEEDYRRKRDKNNQVFFNSCIIFCCVYVDILFY